MASVEERRGKEREREKKNRGKEREKGMIHTLLLLQSVCKTKVLPHLKLAPYCRVTDNKRTRLSTNQSDVCVQPDYKSPHLSDPSYYPAVQGAPERTMINTQAHRSQ